MSRKANYGYDYEDDYIDYDDYEDYEYDEDDHEYAEKGKAAAATQKTVEPRLWACSICTYDNHESITYCEMCGVLRSDPSSSRKNIDKKSGETDAPSGGAVNNVVHTQSNAREITSTTASKGKTIPIQRNNFTSSSNVSRSTDVGSPPNYGRSDNFSSRKSNFKDTIAESSSFVNGGKLESISNGLEDMSLNIKPRPSKPIIARKTLAQYKPENWMLPEKQSTKMTQLNLAIVGHVDSGKSTLSGRLLHLMGQISQKQMHKFEKEAKQQGKGSFAYAWALDESAEERERGITMTVAVAYFDTKKYHVVVLDSPGHKDFVPNMISGATQADAAILVIDACIGAYETGMDSIGGQSREHAQLIRSFGVDQIIVAVNKMDVVSYSKERFDLIKQQVGCFLRNCGFKESSISWIPVSAMENQNLTASASEVNLNSWYAGPNLLAAIDMLHPPKRDYEKPLLMPICDVVKTHAMGQVSTCGKLEAGALRSGCKVLVMPMGDIATIRSIECNTQPCTIARAGQNVALVLQGIDITHVRSGGVLCHPDFPVRVSSHLELKILVLDVKIPILTGSQDLRTVIGQGDRHNGLYYLRRAISAFVGSVYASNQGALWHARLGHPSEKIIKLLLFFHNNKVAVPSACEVCHRAKHIRSSFSLSDTSSTELFGLIHCDLWGPYKTLANNGARYFLTIVDDKSRAVWVFVLMTKTEVYEQFMMFVTMVDRQFSVVIGQVRSDNGTKFNILQS